MYREDPIERSMSGCVSIVTQLELKGLMVMDGNPPHGNLSMYGKSSSPSSDRPKSTTTIDQLSLETLILLLIAWSGGGYHFHAWPDRDRVCGGGTNGIELLLVFAHRHHHSAAVLLGTYETHAFLSHAVLAVLRCAAGECKPIGFPFLVDGIPQRGPQPLHTYISHMYFTFAQRARARAGALPCMVDFERGLVQLPYPAFFFVFNSFPSFRLEKVTPVVFGVLVVMVVV
ncbi:hypothetical protein FN846DRAFT_945002 [Sphaerosporella brunnea]|uniref:Uncharacterized protein n=1 Tax=Sphaerosporella brunnea TaxID=1250544 RepID=A0A5J5F019_9PEZI|nr:hypothetical protein FN846DRAFT_945002 [Sphaerosporella brunnea]